MKLLDASVHNGELIPTDHLSSLAGGILRSSYGAMSGLVAEDDRFAENYAKLSMKIGVYHYMSTRSSWKEQLDVMLKAIGNKPISYYALDIEMNKFDGEWDNNWTEKNLLNAGRFLDALDEEFGGRGRFYTTASLYRTMLWRVKWVLDRDIWLAYPTGNPQYPPKFDSWFPNAKEYSINRVPEMWQYTWKEDGRKYGFSNPSLDMNRYLGVDFENDFAVVSRDKQPDSRVVHLNRSMPLLDGVQGMIRSIPDTKFEWPVPRLDKTLKWAVTQPYGANAHLAVYKKFGGHEGIDLAAYYTELVSCLPATVKSVVISDSHPYGYHVRTVSNIFGKEYEIIYAHMSEIDVARGDILKKGQRLGKSGSTGNSSGPHLHLTLKIDGEIKDPTPYLGL